MPRNSGRESVSTVNSILLFSTISLIILAVKLYGEKKDKEKSASATEAKCDRARLSIKLDLNSQ